MIYDVLIKVIAFIGVIGVLVTVHEFGHFLVARLCGVRVLIFSIGFGKKICGFHKNGTDFILSAIPLGGYVSLQEEGERVSHEKLKSSVSEDGVSLGEASLFAKCSILIAGPFANIILAGLIYWFIYMIGVSGPKPFVGEVLSGSIAEESGFQFGDKLISIGGNRILTWEGFVHSFLGALMNQVPTKVSVLTEKGVFIERSLNLQSVSLDEVSEVGPFVLLGLMPKKIQITPKIDKVVRGSPADRAGFLAGDYIRSVNGSPSETWSDFTAIVEINAGKEIVVIVDRGGRLIETRVVPEKLRTDSRSVGKIGVTVDLSDVWATEKYGAFQASTLAVRKTFQMSVLTLKFLWKLISLEASTKNLSGPLGIANYAGESAQMGGMELLKFMALVSISLGVINLLPIPMLDGGHLLYYSAEFVLGKPLPMRLRQIGMQVGFVFLVSLFLVATYNDILKLNF